MDKITGNEPVNPVRGSAGLLFNRPYDKGIIEDGLVYSGLTIRQYFVGQALAGLCNKPTYLTRDINEWDVAIKAIEIADRVIEELNKTQ